MILTYNVDVGIPKTPPPLASANIGNGGHPSPPKACRRLKWMVPYCKIKTYCKLYSFVWTNKICKCANLNAYNMQRVKSWITSDSGYFVLNVFCYCASIVDFLANFYFVLQILHVKRFKIRYIISLYFSFLLRYS